MTLYNRYTGLLIGCAIADAMGTVVKYAPNSIINNPTDSLNVNIKPGYWTEPTTLFIYRLKVLMTPSEVNFQNIITELQNICSTGSISDMDDPKLNIVQSAALALYYYNDFISLIISCDRLGGQLCKLWGAIIDTTLHGGHKRTILSPISYSNVILDDNIWTVFPSVDSISTSEPSSDDECLHLVSEVLECFKHSNNYKEGLQKIINNSIDPVNAGALYGQLAGAYYGLIDIDETWMDTVQKSDYLLDTINALIPDVPDVPDAPNVSDAPDAPESPIT
jgi:hypothetical protein